MLPLAEWWYNTNFHTAIGLTPYEVVYGQPPPLHLPYFAGESDNGVVDRSLQKREQMIAELKLQLSRAQHRMKVQADKHRTDRSFNINDWVWLKLQPHRQVSVRGGTNQKLAKKYYGPFQIESIIGKVAYKLKLPATAQVHKVFHVSLLKPFYGSPPLLVSLPDWMADNHSTALVPQAILQKRIRKVQNVAQVQYLVKWFNIPDHEATWESAEQFLQQFPDFPLDDALAQLID